MKEGGNSHCCSIFYMNAGGMEAFEYGYMVTDEGAEATVTAPASAAGEEPADTESASTSKSTSKHQSRRAQVRSAQIRHRQRKVHYQKQLELDIVEYRNLISKTETETAALIAENEAIRVRLRESGIGAPAPPTDEYGNGEQQQQHQFSQWGSLSASPSTKPDQPAEDTTPELFGNIDINELTITLSMDKVMGTPSFNVSSGSPSASQESGPSPAVSSDYQGTGLSRAQEDAAINFILS